MTIETITKRTAPSRTNDPEGTKRNIIEVATKEFAQNGLSGARIDEIAAKTKSSKRMIYYYFGDKDGLYLKVLEDAYSRMRMTEAALDLEDLPPAEALAKLVRFTFDHHNGHEDFIRLVMIENIHHGEFLAKSSVIQKLNVTAIDAVRRLYGRGVEQGVFRAGLDPIEVHWQISALCFFNVSNRATFSQIFKRDLGSRKSLDSLREAVVEMVVRHLKAD
ncbi:TetR/AcrR family transcriptional regulator [Microbaculum marinisediminis]|uniref:TetR family transcriptional regulator n=1 Tax=Microbaculum marinisediminis TaxID=2931392 RepID=A0AAW5R128_9HYPH|nr:TetR/AcrR family transcriptional regulator [Microbaculum sp. A6E488]MCT8973991.1 TetR family transcriptional regulator [Microbaculum sp. A6E488]